MTKHNGDGSWHDLLNLSYAKYITGTIKNTDQASTGLISSPLSFSHSGHYSFTAGIGGSKSSSGYAWGSKIANTSGASLLGFYSTLYNPQGGDNKGYGFSVRCVAKVINKNCL